MITCDDKAGGFDFPEEENDGGEDVGGLGEGFLS